MSIGPGRVFLALIVLGGAAVLGWSIRERLLEDQAPAESSKERGPAPVEAASVGRGPIELRRTFSGTLEASASFIVAPKVAGQVRTVAVDLSDSVTRGQIVVGLDDAEYAQAVMQAQADEAVARAKLTESASALEIAERGLERIRTLSGRGVASDVQLDAARAEQTAKRAQVEVAQAQVTRAAASLEATRIRLGYTRIPAEWSGGGDRRIVARRLVDPGDTVSHGTPLLEIVEIDAVTAVIQVAERDYSRLRVGQDVVIETDAFPGDDFQGKVTRIAPVFRQATRQARVEVGVPNADHRLKPGMFTRATLVLERVEDACIVPGSALTRREDDTGVFLVDAAAGTVSWRSVRPGIRDGERVQILEPELTGTVVTLGHQLLEDGSRVAVAPTAAPGGAKTDEGLPE